MVVEIDITGSPLDQHVVPIEDVEHRASPECPCLPRVDDGVSAANGGRVWIHKRWLDVEGTQR